MMATSPTHRHVVHGHTSSLPPWHPKRAGRLRAAAHAPVALFQRLTASGRLLLLSGLLLLTYLLHGGLQQHRASQHAARATCKERLASAGLDFGDGVDGDIRLSVSRYSIERRRLYERMAGDTAAGSGGGGGGGKAAPQAKGLVLGGVITQGLKQHDLFVARADQRTQRVTLDPVLHALDIPVRAMVMAIVDRVISRQLRAALEQHVVRLLPEGSIWLQDEHMYHATVYHASSHTHPVPAGPEEVEAEAAAIRSVAARTCPIRAVLERIIMTSSGVVIACWQALPSGGEPAELRRDLGQALPRAPPADGQIVREPSILHTTIARLLLPPTNASLAVATAAASSVDRTPQGGAADAGSVLHSSPAAVDASDAATAMAEAMARLPPAPVLLDAVANMSAQLCGIVHTFSELWFVEEQDLLALALRGRFVKHPAPFSCPPGTAPAQTAGGGAGGGFFGGGRDLLRILRFTGVQPSPFVAAASGRLPAPS